MKVIPVQWTAESRRRESEDRASDDAIDRLVDLLLDADELLALVRREGAPRQSIEPYVRRAFEELDAALRTLSD
jgi:hypothetical protein